MERIDYILDFCKELAKQMIVCGANIERVDLCIEHLCHAYGLHDVTCANLTTRISISTSHGGLCLVAILSRWQH